jgi:hypothetical protein
MRKYKQKTNKEGGIIMGTIPDYVECAGVRVPTNWTIPELLAALEQP